MYRSVVGLSIIDVGVVFGAVTNQSVAIAAVELLSKLACITWCSVLN